MTKTKTESVPIPGPPGELVAHEAFMKPDLIIYNATTACPVVVAHSPAGRNLLARHCGIEDAGWICMGRMTTEGHRRFRELQGKIADACLIVRYDQASRRRLNQLTGGEYSAMDRQLP